LLPGWGDELGSRDYDSILVAYKSFGYEPQFVSIDWKYKTIDDWVAEVKSKLSREDIKNSILSGFSFGATAALSLAGYYQPPAKLLLFSLSCYYKQDQETIPKSWMKSIGKNRAAAFAKINFDDLASRINCPTQIFIGSKEDPEMLARAIDAQQKIKNSKLIVVEGAKHDVADPRYTRAIKEALR
jgi:pimeloyl-ACP methyl ester carboxylesterase